MASNEDNRDFDAGSGFAPAIDVRRRRNGFLDGFIALFGSTIEAAIGTVAVLFALTVTGFVIKDAVLANLKDKTGVRVLAERWNERTLAFPIEGADASGRRALFDVVVLTKNYGWVVGSTTELERDGERLSAQAIETEVLAPQLRDGLGRASSLIAVGLASQEGDVDRETQRGGLRAARIAEWVRAVVDRNIPMWTLNLGRYVDPCTDCEDADTSWQRPFIVVAVKRADAGTNISEALADAMSGKENLPSPSRYSTFAMARYTK